MRSLTWFLKTIKNKKLGSNKYFSNCSTKRRKSWSNSKMPKLKITSLTERRSDYQVQWRSSKNIERSKSRIFALNSSKQNLNRTQRNTIKTIFQVSWILLSGFQNNSKLKDLKRCQSMTLSVEKKARAFKSLSEGKEVNLRLSPNLYTQLLPQKLQSRGCLQSVSWAI